MKMSNLMGDGGIDLTIKLIVYQMKSNLMDQEAAKAAAKRLYQKVNFSGGALQSY